MKIQVIGVIFLLIQSLLYGCNNLAIEQEVVHLEATVNSSSISSVTKSINTSTDITVLLSISGTTDAVGVTVSGVAAPYSFKGGSYPGTGGTCGTTISENCSLVFSFSPTDATTSLATITVSYMSALTKKSLSFDLSNSSVLGTCNNPTNEMDDYVSAGVSECDAVWVNTAVTGGNVSLDTRTGLMWSRGSQAGDIVTEVDGVANGSINWFEANGTLATGAACTNADHSNCNPDGESYCGVLNNISYGGYSDWRSPGQKELTQAYIDGGSHNAAVFDVTKSYWGNTTESDDAKWGNYIKFGYGEVADYLKNTANTNGICVRAGATAKILSLMRCIAANDVDDHVGAGSDECNGSWTNATVTGGDISTDLRSGLMWSRESQVGDIVSEVDGLADGKINWFEATGITASGVTCSAVDQSDCNPDGESYCGHLNAVSYGGYTNWRAPAHKEFLQAYVNGGSHVASVFVTLAHTWNATTRSDNTLFARRSRLGYGASSALSKHTALRAICVRYVY